MADFFLLTNEYPMDINSPNVLTSLKWTCCLSGSNNRYTQLSKRNQDVKGVIFAKFEIEGTILTCLN